MSIIISNHEHFLRLSSINTQLQIDHIPGMVYRIAEDMKGPLLIKDREKFDVPEKIYGEPNKFANLIFDEFEETQGTVGAILQGLKGSGKTLTAEILANKMIAKGYPILLLDKPYPAELIKGWIQVCGPCCVMFDEFGKVYDADDRKRLLTLFSDSSLTKVLFVITVNETSELNEFIINRPGRFKFSIAFENISPLALKELFDDVKAPDDLREIFTAYASYSKVSFDVLNYALRSAMKFTDLATMYAHLRLLNVPYVPSRSVSLTEITYKGEEYIGPHEFMVDQDGFHIGLGDRRDRRSTLNELFDWTTVRKEGGKFTADSAGYGRCVGLTLLITEDLTLTVTVEYAPISNQAFVTGDQVSQSAPVLVKTEKTDS